MWYICLMRTLVQVSVAALLWVGMSFADDGKLSKMVLKVDQSQAATAENALASVNGVKSVKYDQKEGQLVVLYDKPTLGCCSRIHGALKEAGVQYTLVSNQEYPACKGEKEHSHESSDATEPSVPVKKVSKKSKKGCCKEKSASGCVGKETSSSSPKKAGCCAKGA